MAKANSAPTNRNLFGLKAEQVRADRIPSHWQSALSLWTNWTPPSEVRGHLEQIADLDQVNQLGNDLLKDKPAKAVADTWRGPKEVLKAGSGSDMEFALAKAGLLTWWLRANHPGWLLGIVVGFAFDGVPCIRSTLVVKESNRVASLLDHGNAKLGSPLIDPKTWGPKDFLPWCCLWTDGEISQYQWPVK